MYNKLWGDQTQRSLKYFNISCEVMPWELIQALAQIKRAAAKVNYDLNLLDVNLSKAIIKAADEILSGMHKDAFPLSIWQTGSGTQTNMNMNEVLSNRANELLSLITHDSLQLVHPNDHVNKSQSSNDVFPSAMHIASMVSLHNKLIPEVEMLRKVLLQKSVEYRDIIKIGRTHLQDAIPLTLGQEISGWECMLRNNIHHIRSIIPRLSEIALGGTAVGTGFGSHSEYSDRIVTELSNLVGYSLISAPNKFESIATCDALVYAHGILKGLAVTMMKIANDVRLLSSGPRCGFGEIKVPSNEPGSSMMPGKVNPTQCESMTMLCCQVIGNDVSISIGGASGQLELNVYRPLIIYNFIQSVRLLSDGIRNFNNYCISGMKPEINRIEEFLSKSLMLVTALSVRIGYDKSAEIAKKAYLENLTLKEASIQSGYVSEREFDNLVSPKKMIGCFTLT